MSSPAPGIFLAIDRIADLRQSRLSATPDPAEIAALAADAGAAGISARWRADRRAVQESDLAALGAMRPMPLCLHVSPSDEDLGLAARVGPDLCCIEPGARREHTTEGGLDVEGLGGGLLQSLSRLRDGGVSVGAFIDPEAAQVDACARLGVGFVVLNAGTYAFQANPEAVGRELARLERAAGCAAAAGLRVYAARSIDFDNVAKLAAIDTIEAFVIGHALVARAVASGMRLAIEAMQEQIEAARGQ